MPVTKKELFLQRLEEIHNTVLEELSDEQVLEILAERKQLTEELALLKKEEKEALSKETELKSQQEKLQKEIELLNQEISPSKEDEELLLLIERRKKLEEDLEKVEQALRSLVTESKASEPVFSEKEEVEELPQEVLKGQQEQVQEEKLAPKETEEVSPLEVKPESVPRPSIFKDDVFGSEEIRTEEVESSEKFSYLLSQLESSRDSLGGFLQGVPEEAKENVFFMLKVAAIDPAYAMHYASGALLQDESFHIKIASIKNTRNTGNALAEMAPAMRTGAVVLEAVKHDFRNVRFALPAMPEYDEILAIAKKGALEKVREFKEVADLSLLIPKVLQKDTAFMEMAKQMIQK